MRAWKAIAGFAGGVRDPRMDLVPRRRLAAALAGLVLRGQQRDPAVVFEFVQRVLHVVGALSPRAALERLPDLVLRERGAWLPPSGQPRHDVPQRLALALGVPAHEVEYGLGVADEGRGHADGVGDAGAGDRARLR